VQRTNAISHPTNPVLRCTVGRMATLDKAAQADAPLNQLMIDVAAEIEA